jgi:peptidoglycan/LPS O-acetylase OafA/YrhL
MIYRKDIDALRAISVIAVIFFHLGFLNNGYLGVDVFFVISGYLITSIIKDEINKGQFSFWKFYERRIRRILPALSFTVVAALIFGYYWMLPDDLENLAQSVIASNLSINNVLMLITSADYWAVKNDYKPLMHTWSLGIEEQFYLIYPLIIFYLSKWKDTFLLLFLVIISVLSVSLFLFYGSTAARFYLLPYRFFELALGGIFAITNVAYPISYSNRFKWFFFVALSYMLVCGFGENRIDVILTVLFSFRLFGSIQQRGAKSNSIFSFF